MNPELTHAHSLQILEMSETGWWYAKCNNREGWVPSTFLTKKATVRQADVTQAPSPAPKPAVTAKPAILAKQPSSSTVPSSDTSKPVPASKPVAVASTGIAAKPAVTQKPAVEAKKPELAAAKPAAAPRKAATTYVAIDDYTAQDLSGLSFKLGNKLELIEKNDNGWWFMKMGEREGWVPSTFLEQAK